MPRIEAEESAPPPNPDGGGDVPWFAKALRYALIAAFLAILAAYVANVVRVLDQIGSPADAAPAAPRPAAYLDKTGNRITELEYRTELGYEAAKAKGIAHHQGCKDMPTIGETDGCRRYVTEQKHIPPYIPQRDFASGKSSAQCREEVDGHFRPLIADMRERGDGHAADVWTRKRWMPELEQCANYDNLRIGKVIHDPASRLSALIGKAERGEAITGDDRRAVTHDLAGVLAFPDCPEKSAYIERSERFFRIADGKEIAVAPAPLQLPCEEFQARLDELDDLQRRDAEEQATLKRSSGEIVDGRRWGELNAARIARLNLRHRYTEGAKAAGCGLATAR